MGRVTRTLISGAALVAVMVPGASLAPAQAATLAASGPASAAQSGIPPAAGASTALAVPAKKKAKKKTKILGWKSARKARNPRAALRTLTITGPGQRPVKVQLKTVKKAKKGSKKTTTRWKTDSTVRTSADRGLDVTFMADQAGSWRLKVRAWRGWRAKTTAALRVTKAVASNPAAGGGTASDPAASPAANPAMLGSPAPS